MRIEEGPLVGALTAAFGPKYAGGVRIGTEAATSGYLWLFEFARRG